jgi:MSHA pilin protein MshD
MCTTSHTRRQAGFTLIELIIFIVVVGVGLAGILAVFNVSVASSADPMVHKQASALADSILEEILLKSYDDPDGTNVGETGRADWDNVDDYVGKSNTDFGLATGDLASYTIAITVTDPATVGGVSMKKVTVTVTHSGQSISMVGYRANF